MGCNCGKRKMIAQTSANIPAGAPDRPDIAAQKENLERRVEAVKADNNNNA